MFRLIILRMKPRCVRPLRRSFRQWHRWLTRLVKRGDETRIHLSGGQDSRAVAATIRHHGVKPQCITHNTPNEEVPSAKRVARHLGMKYTTVDGFLPEWETFIRQAEASMWQSDGLMSLKYLAGRYDQVFIRDEGYQPVEGLGGEYGRAYYFGSDEAAEVVGAGRFDTVFKKSLGGRDRWWKQANDLDQIRQSISSILDRYQSDGLDPYQVTTSYYVNQKMRRWATARRNIGWRWVIDPLMMPCWTYRGMSANPEDQMNDRLIGTLIETAWPGTTKVPTVPELAYAARRRRVASNRLVRGVMKVYDYFQKPTPPPVGLRSLQIMRTQLLDQIEQAQDVMGGLVSPDVVNGWLDSEPWSYLQTELFWHTVTLAVWGACISPE